MKTVLGIALFTAIMGTTPLFAAEATQKNLAESDKLESSMWWKSRAIPARWRPGLVR